MKKELKQKSKHIYWNPYYGGFLLGILILFTFYLTGRGLGASGAMKSSVVSIIESVSPTHAEESNYYSKFITEDESPMKNWLVFETLGVLIGVVISPCWPFLVRLMQQPTSLEKTGFN